MARYPLTLQISVLMHSSSISRDRLVFGCDDSIVNLRCVLFNIFSERDDNLLLRSYASMWLKVEYPRAFIPFPDGRFTEMNIFSSVYLPK